MENYKWNGLGGKFLPILILFSFAHKSHLRQHRIFGSNERKQHPASYEEADKYSFARQRVRP